MDATPTIHMNGTPYETFAKHLGDAATHLRRAHASLAQIKPHMRDFYVKEGGGQTEFAIASEAHRWRIQRIEQTLDSVMGLHLALSQQIKEKWK